jgi:hypothetical protein
MGKRKIESEMMQPARSPSQASIGEAHTSPSYCNGQLHHVTRWEVARKSRLLILILATEAMNLLYARQWLAGGFHG